MSSNSLEIFHRSLDKVFEALKRNLDLLLQEMTQSDVSRRQAAFVCARESVENIQALLSPSDHPQWLTAVHSAMSAFPNGLQNVTQCFQLTQAIALQYAQIRSHEWSFDDEDATTLAFDFDALYERYRDESDLSDLFDQLIEGLGKLVIADEIDSRKAIQALEKLIDTLKKNKNGSYFSMIASWDLVVGVFRTWLWDELCKVPVAGGLLNAIKQNLDDTNEAMSKLHATMQEEVQSQIRAEIDLLIYSDRDLLRLPSSLPPVDVELLEER